MNKLVMIPKPNKIRMIKPIGTPANICVSLVSYVGRTSAGGGVNVGNRVDNGVVINCEAIVGSIVNVTFGCGEGGIATTAIVGLTLLQDAVMSRHGLVSELPAYRLRSGEVVYVPETAQPR